jgi:hypothetical protein
VLAHTKKLMEYNGGVIAINQKRNKLIMLLRTTAGKGDGSLDKEATSFDDTFDAFRLSLIPWHYQLVREW